LDKIPTWPDRKRACLTAGGPIFYSNLSARRQVLGLLQEFLLMFKEPKIKALTNFNLDPNTFLLQESHNFYYLMGQE